VGLSNSLDESKEKHESFKTSAITLLESHRAAISQLNDELKQSQANEVRIREKLDDTAKEQQKLSTQQMHSDYQ
jgi:septal ring factor EnvC (AmiA/AmiB activator)